MVADVCGKRNTAIVVVWDTSEIPRVLTAELP
jgi:hypothetical protein